MLLKKNVIIGIQLSLMRIPQWLIRALPLKHTHISTAIYKVTLPKEGSWGQLPCPHTTHS